MSVEGPSGGEALLHAVLSHLVRGAAAEGDAAVRNDAAAEGDAEARGDAAAEGGTAAEGEAAEDGNCPEL